jgi:hypothetical protein
VDKVLLVEVVLLIQTPALVAVVEQGLLEYLRWQVILEVVVEQDYVQPLLVLEFFMLGAVVEVETLLFLAAQLV